MRWLMSLFVLLCFPVATCIVYGQQSDEIALRFKVEGYRYYYGVGGKPLNYTQALRFYRQAAERGDAEAQFIVGGMLYRGQGRDPDRRNGFKWLLKAAEQGKTSPESLHIIGGSYLRGTLVPQNYIEAKKWLNLAAEQGHVGAKNDLAYILYNGLGGERDYHKALELYEQAALRGDILAQANTGLMHATGTGTATDRARGYAWYSLAASRGNTMAALYRNNLMLTMSWEELNRAQAIAVDLYRRIELLASDPDEMSAADQP